MYFDLYMIHASNTRGDYMGILVVANQKGGVGKSTTAHSMSAGLSLKGFHVLSIDMDPQGNLSHVMRANMEHESIFEVLLKRTGAAESVQEMPGGEIIPSSGALSSLDMELNQPGREYKLREAIAPLCKDYDYIVIDTPPTLGILTINALTAATSLIIPAQADVFCLQGLGQLHNTIQIVRRYCNPTLAINGILLTRHTERTVLSRELSEVVGDIARQMGTHVFKTTIREGIAMKEAQANRQDIFSYAPYSKPAIDYMAFIEELLNQKQRKRRG
jgi:chromosome partitioning protein